MPTSQVCVTVPVDGSIATTVFWPLTAAYSVEPSGEYAMPAVSAFLPSWVGIETLVAAAERAVGIDGEPGEAGRVGHPEVLAVG